MNKKLMQRILENSEKIINYHKQREEKKISDRELMEHLETLAIPGGLTHTLNSLKNSDQDAIEMAIAFLQADPDFYRSGYVKEQLLVLLKKVPLSKEHRATLQEILLDKITRKSGREYTDYCKLARVIQDDQFKKKVEDILTSTDNSIYKEKAKIMLDMMSSQGSLKEKDSV